MEVEKEWIKNVLGREGMNNDGVGEEGMDKEGGWRRNG